MSEVLDPKHSPSPGAHSSSNWEPEIWELWHGLSKLCSAVLCFACALSFLWLKLTKCALETFVTTSKSGRDHLGLTLLFPGRIPRLCGHLRDELEEDLEESRLPSPPVTAAVRLVKENRKKIFACFQLAIREIYSLSSTFEG